MNLQHRQEKIQSRRKQTSWRDFVMEITSRCSLVLYRNQGMISKFPASDNIKLCTRAAFELERDNLTTYGKEYNGSNFLSQFEDLLQSTYLPPMLQRGVNENCEYADTVLNAKNGYLAFGLVNDVENIAYSRTVKDHSKNIFNSLMVIGYCDQVHQCLSVINSSFVFYSKFITNSSQIRFSSNLIGCRECILCDNLDNQSYCIRNQQLSKEEYMRQKESILQQKNVFSDRYNDVNTISSNILSDQVTGNGMTECSDIEQGYLIQNVHHGRNLFLGGSTLGNEHMYDCTSFGSPISSHVYGGYSINNEHVYCSVHSAGSSYIFYSYYMEDCSFCLGCVGLRNKSYCILNKQYTKEERYTKVDEIFAQMENTPLDPPYEGRNQLGEFFPPSMNPFYFNDTAAYLIDNSFTKEEVTAKGYLRRDDPITVDIPEGAEVVKNSELDIFEGWKDSQGRVILNSFQDLDAALTVEVQEINSAGQDKAKNRRIDPDILNKVIQDEQGNVRKIVKMEYDFLLKHGLPLPRKHRLDRMKENFTISS